MCLYPTLIKNPKFKKNKKNKGVIPPCIDERTKYVPIGCQQCIECRKQKARGWQIRLLEDIKEHKNGKFITLTFSNESIHKIITELGDTKLEGFELDNQIATHATRMFLERWRKKFKKSARHFLVTELGHNGTENIHLHGIIWTNESFQTIAERWQYGHIWPTKEGYKTNYVTQRTVNYIIKYITKQDEKYKTYKSKILTSPGIGRNYTNGQDWKTNKYNGEKTKETYKTSTGHKIAMPTYWRNKIYTEEEREKLWIQKLNKQERWICGEKIDISNTEQEYYNLLKYHRQRSKQLGYGDNKKDWSREQYEKQRRNLKIKERIKNIK